MSLQTIVIALLVLVVLVVLIIIFSGRAAWFTGSMKSCATAGGECKAVNSCPAGEREFYGTDCSKDTTKKCCVKVLDG